MSTSMSSSKDASGLLLADRYKPARKYRSTVFKSRLTRSRASDAMTRLESGVVNAVSFASWMFASSYGQAYPFNTFGTQLNVGAQR